MHRTKSRVTSVSSPQVPFPFCTITYISELGEPVLSVVQPGFDPNRVTAETVGFAKLGQKLATGHTKINAALYVKKKHNITAKLSSFSISKRQLELSMGFRFFLSVSFLSKSFFFTTEFHGFMYVPLCKSFKINVQSLAIKITEPEQCI